MENRCALSNLSLECFQRRFFVKQGRSSEELGKTLAGEDLQGLTRSFYLGGSLAVLSSLWPVEDEGARQFMNEFYQQFQNTKRFDQAWLAARNSLRNSGASPSVYGAFVLAGSARI